jgi:hypothetical protein
MFSLLAIDYFTQHVVQLRILLLEAFCPENQHFLSQQVQLWNVFNVTKPPLAPQMKQPFFLENAINSQWI